MAPLWDLSSFTRSLTHSSTCRFFLSHYILFLPCPPPLNLCSCASLVFFKGSHPFSSLHSLTLSWTIFPSDCWLPPHLSFKSQLKCTSSADRPPGCLNQISPPRPLTACFVSLASVTQADLTPLLARISERVYSSGVCREAEWLGPGIPGCWGPRLPKHLQQNVV